MMRESLYFDSSVGRFLTADDTTPFDSSGELRSVPPFLHPAGFPIFLDGDTILASDEYAEGDPYHVETGMDSPFQRRRREVTLAWIGECCHSRSRVLDLGCGEGHISEEIRRLAGVDLLCGLDQSISAVVKGTNRYPSIEFCVADATRPPYPDAHFDVVVCNNLWEHVRDPLKLLEGIRRMLKPQSCCLISTPSRYRISNMCYVALGQPPKLMSKHHVTEYTVGQVREQLDFGGFDIVKLGCPSVTSDTAGPLSWVAHRLIKPCVAAYLRLIRSEHCLESTVFFLARTRE